jgi:hypothetical protein
MNRLILTLVVCILACITKLSAQQSYSANSTIPIVINRIPNTSSTRPKAPARNILIGYIVNGQIQISSEIDSNDLIITLYTSNSSQVISDYSEPIYLSHDTISMEIWYTDESGNSYTTTYYI